ncbi:F0F1 ATP synthase subunit delta [Luteolibacter flavescens]|uniref:F0F1 ATP synthase subunit delta n=1 Tax=Luteolibacter flavescens TaxID=1859460 RepID=A0ABT3FK42_9BACT|nr:F0F1 ATP synthase subunit delta [Luteolibacter flavescens]MCW1883937.1 F0F1 ATP synthase subunit delta [Luteolibacter flavescens]
MKISKVANAEARRIFRLCQTDGRFDEAKLSNAIKIIVAQKPRDYRGILSALQRLVRLELQRRHVIVESAAQLDLPSQQRVVSGLEAKYGNDLTFEYRVTPELLGGLKIRVGNDVFDGSVKGRLDRLAEAF